MFMHSHFLSSPRSIASERATSSRAITKMPDSEVTISSLPPLNVTTTGLPHAIASIWTTPKLSRILGNTNSSLFAIIAKRLRIPVVHMGAGNQCYDDHVPEEVNHCIIDHFSDILLQYTERSLALSGNVSRTNAFLLQETLS